MSEAQKKLALAFGDEHFIEEYYQKLKGIFLLPGTFTSKGLILDLNSLPTEPVDLKTTFIKWMIEINKPRITKGEEPIMTLELALKCPIFRMIKPPLVKMKLTPEQVFNKPSIKTIGQKSSAGSINRG